MAAPEIIDGTLSGKMCIRDSVYDDGRAVRQEGLFLLAAVDEVRQQEVVVADLNRVLLSLIHILIYSAAQ